MVQQGSKGCRKRRRRWDIEGDTLGPIQGDSMATLSFSLPVAGGDVAWSDPVAS